MTALCYVCHEMTFDQLIKIWILFYTALYPPFLQYPFSKIWLFLSKVTFSPFKVESQIITQIKLHDGASSVIIIEVLICCMHKCIFKQKPTRISVFVSHPFSFLFPSQPCLDDKVNLTDLSVLPIILFSPLLVHLPIRIHLPLPKRSFCGQGANCCAYRTSEPLTTFSRI